MAAKRKKAKLAANEAGVEPEDSVDELDEPDQDEPDWKTVALDSMKAMSPDASSGWRSVCCARPAS